MKVNCVTWVLVTAAFLITTSLAAANPAISARVVNLFKATGIDPDGPSTAFTNNFGVPVLITDIQVGCDGSCRDVRVFTSSNGFNVGFGVVPGSSEDEIRSFTTGVLWMPGEGLTVFKNGGGRLFIAVSGIKLKS